MFTLKNEGFLVGLRLIHTSGYVTCSRLRSSRKSRWGCNTGKLEHNILTVITDYRKKPIFNNQDKLQEGYNGKTSDFLTFVDKGNPIYGDKGMELQIWYHDDLINEGELDNHGTHCVDVYGAFRSVS